MTIIERAEPIENVASSEDQVLTPPRSARRSLFFLLLAAAAVFAFLLTLAWGSVSIPLPEVVAILFGQEAREPTWATIVLDLRLPRAMTAALVGAALGIAGLQMQTVFRNALADPYILGVSSGAGLGVALVIFTGAAEGAAFAIGGLVGNGSLVVGAAFGAGLVLALMLAVSAWTHDTTLVLVVGVVIGAFVAAIVTIFVFFADEQRTRAFVEWGFGSFQKAGWAEIKVMAPALLVGIAIAALTTKQLNALLLGENYARSMGVSVGLSRLVILGSASLLAGTVVAYAGPIAFLGIAIPHLTRGIFGTSDHRVLVPGCILLGAAVALACGILAELPNSSLTFPLNAATAVIGAPIVLWVLLRMRRGLVV
jgi:iron complex transport system permease protein